MQEFVLNNWRMLAEIISLTIVYSYAHNRGYTKAILFYTKKQERINAEKKQQEEIAELIKEGYTYVK
jgi:hypothetical protein